MITATQLGAADSPAPLTAVRRRLDAAQPVRIVCFGDSITGVYYHSGGRRAWPELLQLALNRSYPAGRVEVINAGVSGNTTADALKRLDHDVLRLQPNLVAMMFGMNDVTRLSPETFRANLTALAQRIQRAGAALVLMTPNLVYPDDPDRPLPKLLAYAAIVREVAAATGATLVDCTREQQTLLAFDRAGWTDLMSETIHPNLRGHIWFAEAVAQAITGRSAALEPLALPQPALPRVSDVLRRREVLRVVAMKPLDQAIGPALQAVCPGVVVNVTAWEVEGKSLAVLAEEAKRFGWWHRREQPQDPAPDLVVIAVPATAMAADREQFRREYAAILNNALSFGASSAMPGWDCVVVAPSVVRPELTPFQRYLERQGREVGADKDLPYLERPPGTAGTMEAVLEDWLRRNLAGAP